MNSTPESGESPAEAVPSSDDAEAVVGIADPALLDAHDLALAALREITPATTIGEPAGYRIEADGVVSLRFENTLGGYPGWFWTVSLARTEDADPTVLEVELLPGDGALLAPDWVPWAERLADYQAAQAALAELAQAEEADVDVDDLDDLDAADFDDDGSPILHAGDVDGVDIDELDVDSEDYESEDDEEDEDEDLDDEDDEDDSEDDSEADDSEDEDTDEYDPSERDDSDD